MIKVTVTKISPRSSARQPRSVVVRIPGPQGFVGPQGAVGPQGLQGAQGVQGPVGSQGPTGPQGSTGPVGPQGAQGDTGAQGPQGAVGAQGATGPVGPQGVTGAQGPQGAQGFTGPQGETGAQGPQGPQGDTGPQGDVGPQGPIGPTEESAVANVLYVSKDGSDTNNGTTLAQSFLTIKAALAAASAGTTIMLKSGDYTEDNPMVVPTRVAIVGDNLRTVTVRPLNVNQDLFYVNNGSYLTGMTFRDHVDGAAAVAFNPDSSAGPIFTSPYIQNCSSITTTGTGLFIDGSKVSGLKSMVTDSYTQFNQDGIGIHITNGGYAQLVSVFTICCDVGFLVEGGASCSISNSNCAFGNVGLKADTNGVINASSHTFEFVGTGTSILTATPALGGIPIQENEVVEENGGKVFYTSTDQLGDFRVGNNFVINEANGTITGEVFNRSLFAILTPYILAIEG